MRWILLPLLSPVLIFADISLAGYSGVSMLSPKTDSYPLSIQGCFYYGASVGLLVSRTVNIELDFGWNEAGQSYQVNGVVYRAFKGYSAMAGISFRTDDASPTLPVALDCGLAVSAAAHFDNYRMTTLYQFYMGFQISPFVEIALTSLRLFSLRADLPIGVYFREPQSIFGECGLKLSLVMYPFFWLREQ